MKSTRGLGLVLLTIALVNPVEPETIGIQSLTLYNNGKNDCGNLR